MSLSNKLFKIESSELPKVLDFAMLGALLQAGISIGLASADTIFLSKLGPEKLPLIYMLTPLVFLIYIPIYSYLTSRIGVNNVFKLTLSILAIGGVAIFFLLNSKLGEYEHAAIYAVKLYSILWYIALYTLFWNFVDGFFDILDAKRVFSALSAGSALGAALGGAAVSGLATSCTVDELFLAWSLTAAASYPALCRCMKRWKLLENEIIPVNQSNGIVSETRSLIKTFRSSSFAVVLGSLLFLTMIVTLVCEYQYSHVLSKGRTEGELAYLFGILFCAVHSINLFINLFVFNRLVLHFGVRNVALIQPVVYTLAFVLFIFDHSFLAGVFGFFAFHGILTSIDFNNTNLLINALPKENKRQLRTFIEGICEPMANAVAGIFLIFVVAKISPVQISAIGLASAVACFALALILRESYLKSMVSNLKKSWMNFTGNTSGVFEKFTAADFSNLESIIREGDGDLPAFCLGLVATADSKNALPAFLDYLSVAEHCRQAEVIPLFNKILSETGDKYSVEIIAWFEKNIENLHSSVVEVLAEHDLISELIAERLSNDQSISLAAAMAVKGINSIDSLIGAFGLIRNSLGGSANEKCASLKAIGYSGHGEYADFILPLLKDPEISVRLEGLRAIQKLAGKNAKEIIPALTGILEQGSAEEQILVLECIAKIRDLKTTEQILNNAENLSPAARRRLESVVVSYGLSSIPVTVKLLKDNSCGYKARSVAGRILSRLSAAQLEAISPEIIFSEIQKASDYADRRMIFSVAGRTSPGQEVLRKYCSDQQKVIIDFVLELLALNGRVANFELLLSNLRSRNKKERADAIETIQQACDAKTNRLILPLLNSTYRSKSEEESQTHIQAEDDKCKKLYEALGHSLNSSGQLEAAAAAEALATLGYEMNLNDETRVLLRAKLASYTEKDTAPALLTETLVSILTGAILQNNSYSQIKKIALMQQSGFFQGFSSEELFLISQKTKTLSYTESEEIKTRTGKNIYLVLKGRVRGADGNLHEPFDVIGEEALYRNIPQEVYYSAMTDVVLLKIPSIHVMELIKGNANLGIFILNRRISYRHKTEGFEAKITPGNYSGKIQTAGEAGL